MVSADMLKDRQVDDGTIEFVPPMPEGGDQNAVTAEIGPEDVRNRAVPLLQGIRLQKSFPHIIPTDEKTHVATCTSALEIDQQRDIRAVLSQSTYPITQSRSASNYWADHLLDKNSPGSTPKNPLLDLFEEGKIVMGEAGASRSEVKYVITPSGDIEVVKILGVTIDDRSELAQLLIARFGREAEFMKYGQGKPINIPQYVNKGTHQEARKSYYIMKFIPGSTLESQIKQREKPCSIQEAANEFIFKSLGLQTLHDHGIIHRDVKPANILIEDDGTVCYLDLDAAKVDDAKLQQQQITSMGLTKMGQEIDIAATTRLTGADTALGTTDYMAPEQIKDAATVNTAADVYSLGATLYHVLTGRVLFSGGTGLDKMRRHETEKPDLSMLHPKIAKVLGKMLQKNPNKRCSLDYVIKEMWSLSTLSKQYATVEEYLEQVPWAERKMPITPPPETEDKVSVPSAFASPAKHAEALQQACTRNISVLQANTRSKLLSVKLGLCLGTVAASVAGLTVAGLSMLNSSTGTVNDGKNKANSNMTKKISNPNAQGNPEVRQYREGELILDERGILKTLRFFGGTDRQTEFNAENGILGCDMSNGKWNSAVFHASAEKMQQLLGLPEDEIPAYFKDKDNALLVMLFSHVRENTRYSFGGIQGGWNFIITPEGKMRCFCPKRSVRKQLKSYATGGILDVVQNYNERLTVLPEYVADFPAISDSIVGKALPPGLKKKTMDPLMLEAYSLLPTSEDLEHVLFEKMLNRNLSQMWRRNAGLTIQNK